MYATLPRLAEAGLASRREVAGRNRSDKQVYGITAGGEAALRGWLETPEPG